MVHNGIIENHGTLREALSQDGVACISDTDTEVVAQLIGRALLTQETLLSAVQQVLPMLEGAYALAIVDREAPDTVVLARQGSPLVLGAGIGEHFAGSDTLALRSVTDTFIYLEDGDVAEIVASGYQIFDQSGQLVERVPTRLEAQQEDEGLGEHEHFMRKEIFEQPARLRTTVAQGSAVDSAFGGQLPRCFQRSRRCRFWRVARVTTLGLWPDTGLNRWRVCLVRWRWHLNTAIAIR